MNKEKSITLIVFFLAAINIYAQKMPISFDPIQPGDVIINGHIKNFKGADKTGSLFIQDAITGLENQEVFSIDSAGNFKMSFDLICPTMNSSLRIGNIWFSTYLVPGEIYNLTIKENGTHVFSGENSELNNDIYKLITAINNRFKKDRDMLNLYHTNDQTDFNSFEKFCDDLLNRELAFVDEYCKKGKISQKSGDLIKLDLAYEPAWALIVYRMDFSTTFPKKRKGLPSDFYKHLYDRFQINNPKALGSSYYNLYINNIRDILWEDYFFSNGTIEYLKRTNSFSDRELFLISKQFSKDTTITKTKEFTEFYDEHRNEITQFINKYLTKTLLDSVSNFPDGIGRDLIISRGILFFYLKNQTSSPSADEWIRIDSLISNKSVLSQLRKVDQFNHVKAFRSITDKPNILPPLLKSEADKIFEKLIVRYRGKEIYVDFWATWCGPCRQEIPYSKVLSAHFAGQDVIFLNLCCQSDKKDWEFVIKSEQMAGDHYLLNTDEYNILSKLFDIHGVPTYALIDKKGIICNKNAPRPGQGQMTIAAIDKLLK
ncbi:MAG: TlpA family protein disulfide reductase [Methanococcaceae archaeon]